MSPIARDSRGDDTNPQEPDEARSEAERDVDRVLYTYYFRRLAEITQVASYEGRISKRQPVGSTALQHNRLTHSLKVAQVGVRLTSHILRDPESAAGLGVVPGSIDPAVVEAAGRAHDLGHPPFGHIGEEVLDEIAREHGLADGFEGNAQTFRILSSLVIRISRTALAGPPGLRLTSASLAACCKYPWKRQDKGKRFLKYGFIDLDETYFNTMVKPRLPASETPTLEAEIMDWADDISYASHDIEDFAADGSIPLTQLIHQNIGTPQDPVWRATFQDDFDKFWDYATARLNQVGKVTHAETREAFARLSTSFPRRRPTGTLLSAAYLGSLSSEIIRQAFNGTHVSASGRLDVDEKVRSLINVLKQLTWYYVIDTPRLVAAQRGQRRRLRAVTEELIAWSVDALREKDEKPWGETTMLTANEQRANAGTIPPLLYEFIERLLSANNKSGAYRDNRHYNVVRGVLDYVASLPEVEVDEYHDVLFG